MSPRRRRNRGVGRAVILVIQVIPEVVRGVIREVTQEVIQGADQEATPDVVQEVTQEATPDAIQGNTPEAGRVTTLVPKEAAVTVTISLSCNKRINNDHACFHDLEYSLCDYFLCCESHLQSKCKNEPL